MGGLIWVDTRCPLSIHWKKSLVQNSIFIYINWSLCLMTTSLWGLHADKTIYELVSLKIQVSFKYGANPMAFIVSVLKYKHSWNKYPLMMAKTQNQSWLTNFYIYKRERERGYKCIHLDWIYIR